MRFEVLDVGYGSCAYLIADNGNLMLFDCGGDTERGISPTSQLLRGRQQSVELFFVSNYDEDHISDLPNLRRWMAIKVLHRNSTVSADQLESLKNQVGPITDAMKQLLEMIRLYTATVTQAPVFPDVEYAVFCNRYPIDFEDTNNLSLVTFVRAKSLSIILPGEAELKLISGEEDISRSAAAKFPYPLGCRL